MSSRINIIIAEPSVIIRCGVVTLLQRAASLNCNIVEVSDLTAISLTNLKESPDLLIINPSYLGIFSPSQLRADLGNENLKIVALQRVLTDQSLLQNYDETLSIYDSAETITEKIIAVTRSGEEPESDAKRELSAREKEIIVCVVKGMTNKQIADELCLSTHTVIAHRRNIAAKLQIHSPSGLTIYAIVNKLVDLADIKNSISQGKEEE